MNREAKAENVAIVKLQTLEILCVLGLSVSKLQYYNAKLISMGLGNFVFRLCAGKHRNCQHTVTQHDLHCKNLIDLERNRAKTLIAEDGPCGHSALMNIVAALRSHHANHVGHSIPAPRLTTYLIHM